LAEILQFIRPDSISFDPEVIAILCVAYDRATAGLHDRGHAQIVREVIAKRIIAAAAKGERDPERLSNFALVTAGLRRRMPLT